MRASILAFIFIISEYSIITGGDGNCGDPPEIKNGEKVKHATSKFRMKCKEEYVRQAGTSNLFKCINNKWSNNPPLVCMRNPLLPPPTATTTTLTPRSLLTVITKTHYENTQPGKSTSTVSGNIVFTTAHTSPTTPQMFSQTSQRTTTMEETTVAISITPKITVSSTTERLTTVSSHSPSILSSTSTGVPHNETVKRVQLNKETTAGIIIFVIIAGLATTIAVLFWYQRSRSHRTAGHSVEMKTHDPDSDCPLIIPHTTLTNCPTDSIQPPVTVFKDSPESTYANATLSA